MNRSELVQEVARASDLTRQMRTAVFERMIEALVKGEHVERAHP